MGQLKELLSEYLSKTSYYEQKPFLEDSDLKEYFERLIYLRNRIKLHLNPTDDKDKEIIKLIDKINKKIFSLYDFRKFYLMKDETPEDYLKKLKSIPDEITKELYVKIHQNYSCDDIEKMLTDKDSELRMKFFKLFNEELHKIIKERFGYKGKSELITWCEQLTELSSKYLKEEWERVKEEAQDGKPRKKLIQVRLIQNYQKIALIIIGRFLLLGILLAFFATNYSIITITIFFLILIYLTISPFLKELLESINTLWKYSLLIISTEILVWISIIFIINRLLILFPTGKIDNWIIYGYVFLLLVLKIIFTILPKWSTLKNCNNN